MHVSVKVRPYTHTFTTHDGTRAVATNKDGEWEFNYRGRYLIGSDPDVLQAEIHAADATEAAKAARRARTDGEEPVYALVPEGSDLLRVEVRAVPRLRSYLPARVLARFEDDRETTVEAGNLLVDLTEEQRAEYARLNAARLAAVDTRLARSTAPGPKFSHGSVEVEYEPSGRQWAARIVEPEPIATLAKLGQLPAVYKAATPGRASQAAQDSMRAYLYPWTVLTNAGPARVVRTADVDAAWRHVFATESDARAFADADIAYNDACDALDAFKAAHRFDHRVLAP